MLNSQPPSSIKVEKSVPQPRSMSIHQRRRSSTIALNRFHTWPPTGSVLAVTTNTTTFSPLKSEITGDHNETEDQSLWWTWEQNHDIALSPLPPFYVLDRSSMVVQQSLEQLLKRIDNFLRLKSIASVFHAKEARLDCRISGGVASFAIYLWKSSNKDSIIVELQRRSGCCILMHHVQKALFHYILTGEEPTNQTASSTPGSSCLARSGSFHDTMARAVCGKIKRQEALKRKESVSEETRCQDNVSICRDLLESHWEDHHRLGMESLVLMTNPYVSCETLAKSVSRALVYDDDGGDALRDKVLKNLANNERPSAHTSTSSNDADDDDELEYAQGAEYGILHNLALHALVNALEVVSTARQDSTKREINLASDYWREIIVALVYNLSVAEHRPDEASLSARCLSLLQDAASATGSNTSGGGILGILMKHDHFLLDCFRAQDFGRAHHLRLEQESRNLLGRLTAI